MLKQIEKNIIYSFNLAKEDIKKIERDTEDLKRTQQKIIEMLDDMKASDVQLFKKITELSFRISKPAKETKVIVHEGEKNRGFVASKTGKNFHRPNCPFGQNIKPKNKVSFKSKIKALNKGFKPCKCINKR